MKKIILTLALLAGLFGSALAQKHFVNLTAGYSSLSPSMNNGYFIRADYTTRFLYIFRTGLGVASNSFMDVGQGYISHEDNLDLDAKVGLAIKLIGFRIEGGLGVFLRYWNRSYSTDSNTYHDFMLQSHTLSLSPGQIEAYNYYSFGGFSYLSVGVDVNDWLGLKVYAQYKSDKLGDDIFNLGGGIYFKLD